MLRKVHWFIDACFSLFLALVFGTPAPTRSICPPHPVPVYCHGGGRLVRETMAPPSAQPVPLDNSAFFQILDHRLALKLTDLVAPAEKGGDCVGDCGGASIHETLLHSIPHGIEPLETGTERCVQNAPKVSDCWPVAVPDASIVGSPIVDGVHGEENQDTLHETDDFRLPVFADIGSEDRWLEPLRHAQCLLVHREYPSSEFFLDDLATIVIIAANSVFTGICSNGCGTRRQ